MSGAWKGKGVMDRRTVLRGLLRGAAVAVALPPLEAMLGPHGGALADGTALPTRFGVWFWGCGVRPETWNPSGTGTGWTASNSLEPLVPHQAYVSPITGCHIKTATHAHHSGMTGIMTGQRYAQLGTTRDTIVTTFARQSVDQDAADHFSGLTPFRSLELGVTRFHGTDEGSTFQHLSHNGPNLPNPSEYDPVNLYNRLFGTPTDAQVDLARQSVLDSVMGQISGLKRQLGASDRARLDQHLESVRTLEQRLGRDASACGLVEAPERLVDSGLEPIEEKNAAMSELLALALACDLTRAFSVQFSTCGSGVVMWQVGAANGLHLTTHEEAAPQPIVQAATRFTMEQLAHFLGVLKGTPEGDGNLLDRCSILCTTELTDGRVHSNYEFPILVCGKGDGRLRGGVHARSGSAENTSTAVLTALRGAGIDLPAWGVDEGRSSSVFSELLA
jgi:hypothetical protein